jgi:hypothetical protein
MNSLEELQKTFLEFLFDPTQQMDTEVTDGAHVNIEQRLNIYAEGYRLRLLDALADNFPALHTLLGDDEFHKLGRAYIQSHPSRHFSIRYFGDRLHHFLSTQAPYTDMPLLSEMASFEWLLRDVFDAADAAVLNTKDLQNVEASQWPLVRFAFHPTVRLLELSWNVPALWKAIDNDEPPQSPERSDHPLWWVVWRQDLKSYFRSLPVDEAWAINAMLQGRNFLNLCEGLCEWVDELHAPARAAGFIQQWVNDGLISVIDISQGLEN